jgi:GTPase SAR1 family protein
MDPSMNSTGKTEVKKRKSIRTEWPLSRKIKCPGLTSGTNEIIGLTKELPKKLAIFSYKQSVPYLWLVFVGGTGTGKSTLFNAFCGMPLSSTGVERPKTCGPIAFAHRDCPIEKGFPFSAIQIERQPSKKITPEAATGQPGHFLVLEHDRQEWARLVVVDTPDLDSVEAVNRQITQDLNLLSDGVIFVTSPEKYADEIPFQQLQRIMREKKPCFFIINKAQDELAIQEVTSTLESNGISLRKENMWSIPFAHSNVFQWISEHATFRDFISHLSEKFSVEQTDECLEKLNLRRSADLISQVNRLIKLMEKEELATKKWLGELDVLCQTVSQELIKEQKGRFTAESRSYLQTEIRKLFTKYDVFAKPRKFVKDLFLTPFRLLGFLKKGDRERHRQGLLRVRQKIDLTPVQMSILKFNRLVLEKLSPSDETSPLFAKLREPGLLMSDKEIKRRVWEEQDQMAAWLEETFERLSRGIPMHKEWGIYSTSLLWGILILSFETVVGGGFTVIDAALDAAIAPFVTKGAVELFAYHEIQKVAKELATRYQDGLVSVLNQQRDRYKQCIQTLITPMEDLKTLRSSLE